MRPLKKEEKDYWREADRWQGARRGQSYTKKDTFFSQTAAEGDISSLPVEILGSNSAIWTESCSQGI